MKFVSGHEEKKKSSRRLQYCIFCNSSVTQLPRHLIRIHNQEERVKILMEYPKKHPERLTEIGRIRREGLVKLMNRNKEELHIRGGIGSGYVKCMNCGCYYGKKTLYRHYKKCSMEKTPKNLLTMANSSKKLEDLPEQINLSEPMKKIILPGIMDKKNDLIKAIVQDEHLVEFGNSLCVRFHNDIHNQKNLIRQKLRTIVKLRLLMSDMDSEINKIIDIFHPEKWECFIKAVQKLTNIDSEDLNKMSPTNVQHIGLLMSGLAKDLEVSCPLQDNEQSKLIKKWVKVFERKYKMTIGWQAAKLVTQKKWKKKKFLPLAEDISKLNQHLKNTITHSIEILQTKFCEEAWKELTKSVMVLILTFNRKRIGEITKLSVEDYRRKEKISKGTDIWNSLSNTEKAIASNYYHLIIRGKHIRPVPLLLNNEMVKAIDLMLYYRTQAGVHPENTSLFAKEGDVNARYSANVVIRQAANECGAQRPQDLRSNLLRKHIATVSQALNLSDSDLKMLSSFLGHTTRTHLEHYRLPNDVVHTAKLSKLLLALDVGKIHNFRGKTIDEIEITEEDDIDIDDPRQMEQVFLPSTSNTEGYNEKESRGMVTPTKKNPVPVSSGTPSSTSTITPIKKKKRWVKEEIMLMKEEFGDHLCSNRLPSFEECNTVRRKYPLLRQRKAVVMKAWVNNQLKKKK